MKADQFVIISSKHRLHPDAYKAFCTMQEQALKEDINIALASSYRSEEQQLAIWNAKWQGERPLFNRDNQLVDPAMLSDIEKLHCILTFSALPGASRHHWGSDMDVYDKQAMEKANQSLQLVETEYQADGPCFKLYLWLQKHAADYGFYFPYEEDKGGIAKEPWHISYESVAEVAMQELTLDKLAAKISQMSILGQSTILNNLDSVYHRYVLNQGI